MAGERGFFDLKKQFVFYASYHNQPINVLIHLFCIWNLGKTIFCIFLSTFNPIPDWRGLIVPAVWKTSSGSFSFDFCDPKPKT